MADTHATRTGDSLLDVTLDLSTVNWEIALYASLILVALFIRFFSLGSQALLPEEAQQARLAWDLYRGAGFSPDVPLQGALPVQVTTLFYFLSGVSDGSARAASALLGAGMLGVVYFLRSYLGRVNAVVVAVLLAFSPTFLYLSRLLRGDIYVAVLALLLMLFVFRFIEGRRASSFYAITALVALSLAASPTGYLTVGVFIAFIALTAVLGRTALRNNEEARQVAGALKSLVTRPGMFGVGLLILAAGAILLQTTFLTSLGHLGASVGSPGYPAPGESIAAPLSWYFYLVALPLYEPVLVVFGTVGLIYWWLLGRQPAEERSGVRRRITLEPSDGGEGNWHLSESFSIWFLSFWVGVALVFYTVLPARRPEFLLQIALPLALLAGMFVGSFLKQVEWRELWDRRAFYLAFVFLLVLASIVAFLGLMGEKSGTPVESARQIAQGIALAVLVLVVLAVAVRFVMLLGERRSWQIAGLTLLAILMAYSIHTAWGVSFNPSLQGVEPLALGRTSDEVPRLVGRLERLSRDLTAFQRSSEDITGGKGLDIAIDENVRWPLEWYLRDFTAAKLFSGDNPGRASGASVIIVAKQNEGRLNGLVQGDYVSQGYRLTWRPSGGIFGFGREAGFDMGQEVGQVVRYLIYREASQPPVPKDFSLLVRKDIADKANLGGPAVSAESGKVYGLFEAAPGGKADGQFNQPRGLATGPNGDFYVIDTGNGRVQKFDSSGTFIGKWGSFGAGDGQFGQIQGGGPVGIAVDKQGNVYVADTWNHRIQKFDSSGQLLVKWGSFFNTKGLEAENRAHPTGFFGPRGLAFDKDGNLYVTDTGNKRVIVFDSQGRVLRQWGVGGRGSGELNEPIGIALDANDTVYVADMRNKRVEKFDKMGQYLGEWSVDGWQQTSYDEPYIAVEPSGLILVSDPPNRRVFRFDSKGMLVGILAPEENAPLVAPTGLVVDPSGGIFVVDTARHAVVKMSG
ncbi:MAG: TIGR03663 family protein [Chloroflexi bacterium]|nr:TIGR03663 family protein [Chloroflexota bacterium]